MSSMNYIVGSYQHEKNENLEEYYNAIGIPFISRKYMLNSSPLMVVAINEEEWIITTSLLVKTHVIKFRLGEEFEEEVPGGTIFKSIATKGDNKLVINSFLVDGTKSIRNYDFSKEGVIISLKQEPSGVIGRRYFKRL